MVIDLVENIKKYGSIPNLEAIIAFMGRMDIAKLSDGDHLIKGKDLYVKVLNYVPKQAEDNNFETHDLYTDVQVLAEGVELMQIVPSKYLHPKPECKMEGDFKFFSADNYISDLIVNKGQFVVFFPHEAHRPGCRYQDLDTPVKKLVFKTK
jgi:biofilm protein TabA